MVKMRRREISFFTTRQTLANTPCGPLYSNNNSNNKDEKFEMFFYCLVVDQKTTSICRRCRRSHLNHHHHHHHQSGGCKLNYIIIQTLPFYFSPQDFVWLNAAFFTVSLPATLLLAEKINHFVFNVVTIKIEFSLLPFILPPLSLAIYSHTLAHSLTKCISFAFNSIFISIFLVSRL